MSDNPEDNHPEGTDQWDEEMMMEVSSPIPGPRYVEVSADM